MQTDIFDYYFIIEKNAALSGYGYQWGVKENLGDLVVCVDKEPWYDFCVEPPCGQLNLVNENVTDVIGI